MSQAVVSQTETGVSKDQRVIVAYLTSWSTVIPDTDFVTHINYAFGHVNSTYNGVRIDNEERLRKLVALKTPQNNLKILLSVGGWGSGRFSEMVSTTKNRKQFALDCKRIIKEFNLDGIDIDWEYPTADMAGISASPEDKDNFSQLMKDIRKAIGRKKTLTLATAANAKYYNFKDFVQYVDFINIMAYDMGSPPYHHSALYPSKNTHTSGHESVLAHIDAGVPVNKLVYGIPFYGRGNGPQLRFLNYKDIHTLEKDYLEKWDDVAKVPYFVNNEENIICVYDNSLSVSLKCNYVLEMQLRGAMYWDYAGDDNSGTLSKTIWKVLKE